MFKKKQLAGAISLNTLLFAGLGVFTHSESAHAQTESVSGSELEEIYILGSRRAARSATDTLAPVDVIGDTELEQVGNTDMHSMLSNLVPSFNVSQQPNSDEAAFIRPANLRSLPPDNTLVLVNGKRRHRGAIISFLGEGLSDGAQGPDISAIPSIALKQVQVLRDGAAAQYGSDAIAGVINFELKDSAEGGSVQMRLGEYYEGDGDSTQLSGNLGLPLTDAGFINLSADYSSAKLTSRTVQTADAADLIAAGNTAVEDPVMIWGAPDVSDNYRLFFNSGLELNDDTTLYAFGNYATKDVETEFFYRNPNTRSGVFTNDGGQTLLVGDVNPTNNISCPTITITNHVPDATALAEISAGGALDSECFAFNELFPGGFTPRMGGTVEDQSFALGMRGDITTQFAYDISANWGQSSADFYLKDSVNASLGAATPTYFQLGQNTQSDTNFNLDLTYALPVSFLSSDLNIAGGVEWREEKYEVVAGEAASYAVGPLAEQNFSSGSNGFAGFGPQSTGIFSRDNIAFYVDLEADVIDNLVLGAAIRWEDFEDFGSTTNGKVSARYDVSDAVALRSTYSTGFRAPTPGQSNIVRTRTQGAFNDQGEFVFIENGILPPTNPIAIELAAIAGGINAEPLEPETSTSFTFGTIVNAGELSLTMDYFRINLEDRIALTSSIEIDRNNPQQKAILDQLSAEGVPGASTFTGFQFFTNDFETLTQGIDIVATLPLDLGTGDTQLALAFNHTETELAQRTALIDEVRETQLEQGLPKNRWTLTGTHLINDWYVMTRINYYNSFVVATDRSDTFDAKYGAKILLDAELGYQINDALSVSVGAQNLLDEYPDEYPNPAANSGQIYPEQSPYGFNGGFYYLRVTQSF